MAHTINLTQEQYERLQKLVTDRRDITDVINTVVNTGLSQIEYRTQQNRLRNIVNKDEDVKELIRLKVQELKQRMQ